MSTPFIGRREAIGLGIEATEGISVSPQTWLRYTKLKLDQKTKVAEDESAIDRVETPSNSDVTEEWAAGSITGNVTDISIGYLLQNIFGSTRLSFAHWRDGSL